jgi:membrane protein YqaA with SNARE-associated domain
LSLFALLGLLVLDGATLGIASNALIIEGGKTHAPWLLAVFGGLASAVGGVAQLFGLRWALSSRHRWARRLAPSEDKLEEAFTRYRRASFLALVVMRATPIPDLPLKLVAAVGRYPIPLFGVAVWLGALPYYFLLAKIGQVVRPPWWAVVAAMAGIALVGTLETWRRHRSRRKASRA